MHKTICVVDDQSSLRQMLRFALSAQGHNVLEAENGVDALDKLASQHVDMMIVDWQMPVMGGLDLVRKLREDPVYQAVPIVIISCRDDVRARRDAYAMGVMTWLKKPFRIAEVQRVVENGLGIASQPAKLGQQSNVGYS